GDFVFYTGAAFPAWNGQAIIAGLVCECLVRVGIDGERASELDRIPLGKRIRDVAQAPDGALWVLEDGARARLRQIRPR
ncbi:MAG: PQQ-dependent sugar dehydrogenase, partial [Novosphingobium sp.]